MRCVLVALLLGSSGCVLLETPCGRVAGSICTIKGEEAACQWLREVPRDNTLAQDACEKAGDSAAAYARAPDSLVAKGRWWASAAVLKTAGFVGLIGKGGTELEKAGRKLRKGAEDTAEVVVEVAEDAEDLARDAAKKAGDVVNDVRDAAKDAAKDMKLQ